MGTSPRCANKWVNHSYLYISTYRRRKDYTSYLLGRDASHAASTVATDIPKNMIGILSFNRRDN